MGFGCHTFNQPVMINHYVSLNINFGGKMHAFFRIFYTRLMDGMTQYHSRLYLVLPVLLACGLYLGIVLPISVWSAVVMIMVALVGWSVAPYVLTGMGGYVLRAVVLVVFGMGWANGWIASHFQYQMPYGGIVAMEGTVADILYKNGKTRYVITDTRAVRLRNKGADVDNTVMATMVPWSDVRLGGMFNPDFKPNIGDTIVGKGVIMPNFAPDFVGGFSVARYLLERGMIGYVNSTKNYRASWRVHGVNSDKWGMDTLQTGVAKTRHRVLQAIKGIDYGNEPSGVVGSAKSIAIALMVGKRDFMGDDDNRAIRQSGLAHVMAISGMHVGLLIGLIFFVMRRCLCLIPSIALRSDTKILAVLIALPVAVFYVLISGMGIPAVRALGMAGIALLGILMYRNAITLRIVVGVGCVMMLVNPLWFMQAGFLLSFSAVLGLVVFAEFYAHWRRNLGNNKPFYTKGILGYAFGILCASGIATIATMPTVVQYFGEFPLYGLIANMIVVPLVSLWVMPMGVLSGIAMVFGLEGVFLPLMFVGIDVMMDVAYGVQGLPHAVMQLQALPAVSYVCVLLAGLWWCLLKSNIVIKGRTNNRGQSIYWGRYVFLLIFVGGVLIAQLSPVPVVMVNKTATTYGIRSIDRIVIAGWTKTMYKDSIIASVAKQFSVAPNAVQHQKCNRKVVCILPINVPVVGDNVGVFQTMMAGTFLQTIFPPATQVKNLVIVPHKASADDITALCNSPKNGIILAPKVYIDYGQCKIPVLGKVDFGNMGSVTIFWDRDGIKLLDDAHDAVVKRQGRKPLPYASQN